MEIDERECLVEFGKLVRDCRVKRGIDQIGLAEKLGITQSQLSHIETGKRNTTISVVFKICAELNLDFQDFLNKYIHK